MALSKIVNTESSFEATCQQKGETKKKSVSNKLKFLSNKLKSVSIKLRPCV